MFPAHATELKASICNDSVEYSLGLISVTNSQPVLDRFEPFGILDN